MKDFFRKNWHYIILGLIVVLAIFLRVWHFSDWVHFGMDQARDANLVSDAVQNGPGQLPLLGPRAGGTYVRLGPIFYYLQYISAEISNSIMPPVFAYPDLLFSVLTIPLFFLFLRRFFSRTASLAVTALYAANFVIIQYSRFAWNPNSIPFWTLLSFFSFLKAIDENRKRQKYLWLLAATVGWAVAGQLHFIVLAAVPLVFFFFLLWTGKWRKLSWKEAVFVVLILLILFSPIILSDIKMKGDNIKQFVWAFQYKPQEHSFVDNLKESVTSRANYYTLILTTYISPTGKASLLAGILLSLFGIGYTINGIQKEKDEKRKNFLKFIFIWGAVAFLVLIPFAFQIKPRFLFFEIFIPFMFVAMGIEWLSSGKKYQNFTRAAAVIAVLAVISLNLEATASWFSKLATDSKFHVWGNRLSFIKYPNAVTLSDTEEEVAYIERKWEENPTKLYFFGNMELRSPPLYLLEATNPKIDYAYFSFSTHDFSGQYFFFTDEKRGFDSLPKKLQLKFDLLSSQRFEKLAVHDLALKPAQPKKSEVKDIEDSSDEEPDSETETNVKKGLKKSDRVLWGEIF
jgi:4-amino-4-deoxy-L-arabinose transferase-like glycosyltransferase